MLADRARADAKRVEERLANGDGDGMALAGVPIAIKDTEDLEGEVTAWGSAAYDEPAAADGEMVRRLRDAGAVVIGKTNLPELAICGFTESEAWGVTRNPWNPDTTPGGSSGGSGAAVAAGLCAGASASDGAGSIRIPARALRAIRAEAAARPHLAGPGSRALARAVRRRFAHPVRRRLGALARRLRGRRRRRSSPSRSSFHRVGSHKARRACGSPTRRRHRGSWRRRS